MKKVTVILALIISYQAISWGATGHRVVGEIAQKHLTKKSKKNLNRVFSHESLAYNATWMDDMKSYSEYDYMKPWHYATIPDGQTYEQAGTPEEGDIIWAINNFTAQLKSDTLTLDEERFALRILIHLVGDIHQPLHVGNGEDRGGNSFKIKYFWEDSNLHRVWDSGMIDGQKLSFTEWAMFIDHNEIGEVEKLQNSTPLDWANESMAMRESVYDTKGSDNLTYAYTQEHRKDIQLRLKQAGIRLAGLINSVYE
ncbi:MAG: S1/P1 nuclease [Cytophagales bacterium]|nr:S1/P1 nuclease [Cytophagales bacterium]